jgi:alkanesulfonate monooxygenase SsuD/methylene tetrahydromethanopterin reductase-like flavin-dependent oxidoreductase (luciferase family)
MKAGLFVNTQFPQGFDVAERVPEILEQVRAAREAGFSSLWFPHHWLTYPMQMLQLTPLMGYVAAYAQGMTIGPNILILPPKNPMHVAEEAATFDVLTGGNYILGLGLGYRQPEFDAFGVPLSERAPRFNEAVADQTACRGPSTHETPPGVCSAGSGGPPDASYRIDDKSASARGRHLPGHPTAGRHLRRGSRHPKHLPHHSERICDQRGRKGLDCRA